MDLDKVGHIVVFIVFEEETEFTGKRGEAEADSANLLAKEGSVREVDGQRR